VAFSPFAYKSRLPDSRDRTTGLPSPQTPIYLLDLYIQTYQEFDSVELKGVS
jgi:hypothetical protein